ncbi:MAG: hypothetical protein WBG27_03710 [Candidatus Aquilonibacter sp.]
MFFASLALSAAVATAPSQSAYTGIQPVRVASCVLEPAAPSLDLAYSPFSAQGEASTVISFVNQAPATIASVTFDVSDGRTTSRIIDKGTFSNGVAIEHSFVTPELGNDPAGLSCSVSSVAFKDGSLWQAQ